MLFVQQTSFIHYWKRNSVFFLMMPITCSLHKSTCVPHCENKSRMLSANHARKTNVSSNWHQHFVTSVVIMWSLLDVVNTQNHGENVHIIRRKKQDNIQSHQTTIRSKFDMAPVWNYTHNKQGQGALIETQPTTKHQTSISHMTDEGIISDSVSNNQTYNGTNPPFSVLTESNTFSDTSQSLSATTESNAIGAISLAILNTTEPNTSGGTSLPVSDTTASNSLGHTSLPVSSFTESSTTNPINSTSAHNTDNCIQCNWTRTHSLTTHIEDTEGHVVWTEPGKSCSCIHDISWHIKPTLDNQGIIFHFTHFSLKWYEHLEVYQGDQRSTDNLLFRHPDLTTAVLLLPHGDISVWIRTMPWPFFTVESSPSSFSLNYSTHPLHLLPIALSNTHMTFKSVAPLIAYALYECSSATIPAYILCDKVQQCVGGEDEPADCPYRSVSCGHPWFVQYDRCLQVVFTSTKDMPQPCDSQSGGKLAVLPAPAEPKLLASIIARVGISGMCLAVDLTYKPISSRSLQVELQYQHIWQWGQGILNHGHQPQRGIQFNSKFALFFSRGKVSIKPFYGSVCDYNTTTIGFLCMKDDVKFTDQGSNSPRSVRLQRHLNNTRSNSTTDMLPFVKLYKHSLKYCTDGSFVLPFQQCPHDNKDLSWSPNNFKLFYCMVWGQVHYALICDGHSDCRDGSDETGCAIPTDISILQAYHVCANGQLIPLMKENYLCDSTPDCLDQSDERLCTTCTEGKIVCPGFGCRPPSYADFLTCTSSDKDRTDTLFTTNIRFPDNKGEMPSSSEEGHDVDLVIILHSYNTLTDHDYQFITEQLTTMLTLINSTSSHVQVGFMLFDSQTHVQFMLKDLGNITENDITDFTLNATGGTNIAGALHMARTEMFSERNGDRSDIPDVILLITAAASDMNSTDVIKEAEETKNGQGIHIMVVGVGVPEAQELENIASWPLQESLFLTKTVSGVGDPLYKIAFSFMPLGKLPHLMDTIKMELINVALNKPATLSQQRGNSNPGKAVDGITGTGHPCAESVPSDLNPHQWWRVNLMGLFEIDSIIVTNNADCCKYRLRNFHIFVTVTEMEPPVSPRTSRDLCHYHAGPFAQGTSKRLHCTHPLRGRYVTLVMYGADTNMMVCEVEVLGVPLLKMPNVAFKKPAAVSSYHSRYDPHKAVDGFRGTAIAQCFYTADKDPNPNRWWSVDLLGLYHVYSIIITNRGDCCAWRLSNFYIYVTLTSMAPSASHQKSGDLCLHHPGRIRSGATVHLSCSQPLKGRYVTLVKYTNEAAIHLCEMEVLGVPLLDNLNPTEGIYPPAVLHMDGLGLSMGKELKDGDEACPDTHFQCTQGFCIPTYLLNNGITDCPLGDDEHIADFTCPGFFRCWITGNCLHPDYLCDGVNHCPFNEDERYCEVEHCPDQCVCEGHAFQCWSGFDYKAHFQLRYLDFSGSDKPGFRGIESLSYLQHLNLSSCKLMEMELSSLNQLHVLDLSHNNISSFDFVKLNQLSELLHLNLSFNPLVNLVDPAFSSFVQRVGFSQLQSLVMVGIGLDTITTKGLTGSTQISVLDVRHNPVKALQTKIFGKSVQVLYTDNHKLCCHHFHMTQLAECHAPVDELSSCSDLLKSDFLRVLLWILSTMALTGNVGVWVYRTFIEHQGTSLAYKVLVINLSASDFLMGVYMATIGVADVIFRGIYVLKEEQWKRSLVCKIVGILGMLSCEMSFFVICLITMDRFFLLRFPFSVRLRLSRWSASVACCMALVTAGILATLPLSVSHWKFYSQNSICLPLPITQRQFSGQQYAFGVFIVLNFILSSVIGIGQVIIYQTIRQSSKGLQKDSRNQDVAIARRLFLIVVTDFCCWFPIGVMGLLGANGVRISDVVNVWTAVFVLPLNSALNPFLYTLNTLLERRARHVEKKRIEKIMANVYLHLRTWPSDKVLEHMRKCVSLGLVAKTDVLDLPSHGPGSAAQDRHEKADGQTA